MFTKSIVFPSIVAAVNKVLAEDAKKKLLLEPEKDSPEVAGGKIEKNKDNKRAASGHSAEVVESHSDEKEDKALVKKMVKKTALKGESKETELDSHHKLASEGAHTQNYMNIDHTVKNKKPEDTTYGRHRQNSADDSKDAYRPKTSWKSDPITAFTNKIHDTIADRFGKKKTNEDVELDERHLTPSETKTKEHNVKAMKKNVKGFKSLYGDRAKSVMYATATKQAETQKEEVEELDELSATKLRKYVDKSQDSTRDNLIKRSVARKFGDDETAKLHLAKADQRQVGIAQANRKLNNEEESVVKKSVKSFRAKKEDIGGISTMSEKSSEAQVRVDGETDMNTKTIDTLKGRKKVSADYHNKVSSYKVGLTVGEETQKEGLGDDILSMTKNMKNPDGSPRFPNAKISPMAGRVKPTNTPNASVSASSQKADSPADWYDRSSGGKRNMGDSVEHDGETTIEEHKGPESDSEPFVQNANTSSSPLGLAKSLAHKSFKKIKNETILGKLGTSE